MQDGAHAVWPCLSAVEEDCKLPGPCKVCSCPNVKNRENAQRVINRTTVTVKILLQGTLFPDVQICAGQCQTVALLYLSENENPSIMGKQSPKVLAGQVYPFFSPSD